MHGRWTDSFLQAPEQPGCQQLALRVQGPHHLPVLPPSLPVGTAPAEPVCSARGRWGFSLPPLLTMGHIPGFVAHLLVVFGVAYLR